MDENNNYKILELALDFLKNTDKAQRLSDIFEQDSRRYQNPLKEEEGARYQ